MFNLVAAIIFIQLGIKSASLYYLALLLSAWVFPIIGWIALHPIFSGLKQNLHEIWVDLDGFGKDAYIGRVPAALANNLDRLLLGYFATAQQVGLYGLSQSLTNPVVFVGGTISQVAYRDFSKADSINRKMIIATFAISVLALAATCGFGVICILFFLPAEYHAMLPLLFIMSFSALFKSFYALFNSFLASKGKGKMLRNLGWTYTVISLVFSGLFIPFWGVIGAAYAAVLINLIWLIQYIWKYIKLKDSVDV